MKSCNKADATLTFVRAPELTMDSMGQEGHAGLATNVVQLVVVFHEAHAKKQRGWTTRRENGTFSMQRAVTKTFDHNDVGKRELEIFMFVILRVIPKSFLGYVCPI